MKRFKSIFKGMVCFIVLAGGFVLGAYSGGSGTEDQPYLISSVADWQELCHDPNNWDMHFLLGSNLDLTDVSITPIGTPAIPFKGVFDGNDLTVSNAAIYQPENDYAGIFGYVGSGGVIKHLGLLEVDIQGRNYVGGLTGTNSGSTIDSCYVTGVIIGSNYVGGLTGYNVDIDSSFATLIYCYSDATVTCSNEYAGGLAGYNSGFITLCYCLGSVDGDKKAGGLVGENSAAITSCYAMGTANGTENIAGLCGYQTGNGAQIVNCFWNEEVSGLSYGYNPADFLPNTNSKIFGKTTVEMLDVQTYLDAGWDFINEPDNGTCDFWMPSTSGATPEFTYHGGFIPPAPIGSVTSEDPYLITDANELGSIWFRPDSYYQLANDVDLSGITWSMAPIPVFRGQFDGNKHRIYNLLIESGGCLGLFGQLNFGSTIVDTGLESCSVSGTCFVGGLTGQNRGQISSCYVNDGVSSGYRYVGGLTGQNMNAVLDCYAHDGNVAGQHTVGGLAGSNTGTISACWASAEVSAVSYSGGLVGDGYWGIVNSSFWNMGSVWDLGKYPSGSSGGKGLSAQQMVTMSVFQNANWAGRGWVMEDGVSFPRLDWEGTGGQAIGAAPSVIPGLSGSGTAEDPYLITAPADFALLSWYTNALSWSKHYKLTADLDMTGVTLYPFGDLGRFNGVFDGNDHTISNVVIHQAESDFVGLFAHIGSSGQVKKLNIDSVSIQSRNFIGALAGWNFGGVIDSCSSSGSINGDMYVGGLTGLHGNGGIMHDCNTIASVSGNDSVGGLSGWNRAIITDSSASGTASGGYNIGGLIGLNWYHVIHSSASGNVDGIGSVGGLAGLNTVDGSIYSCYATGTVSGSGFGTGGLAGKNVNIISSSFATGIVNSTYYRVGGLVGIQAEGTIESCYATGQVNGGTKVGGFVGYAFSGTIDSCFAAGPVSGYNVGGFAGHNDSAVFTACKWDVLTGGTLDGVGNVSPDPNGVLGEETARMQMLDTYIFDGWDFTNEMENGEYNYWRMCADGVDYPRLNWESYTGDFACPDGVNLEDLDDFAGWWLAGACTVYNNYCGGKDLDFSGDVTFADFAVFAEAWMEGI